MRTLLCSALLFTLFVGLALAQPSINANSVVNAASYIEPGLPNYGVAQGSIFILKGKNLGACGVKVGNAFPLPANMGGTSMKITVGGTSVDAIMVYVVACQSGGAPDQLAAIAPSNTPAGDGTVTVSYNGQTSASAAIHIVQNSFGIFTINQSGTGPGVLTDPNYVVNVLTAAAQPGQQLFIWGTGLGPITAGADAGAPPTGTLNVPVEVYVGSQKATVTYAGRSGCCAGLDQILFTVPTGVEGCYVPVTVKINNVVSNVATMSISSQGKTCSDPIGLAATDLATAQSKGNLSVGYVFLSRTGIKLSAGGLSITSNSDTGSAGFVRYDVSKLFGAQNAALNVTAVGSCSVYTFTGSAAALLDPTKPNSLDAGAQITVSGPNGQKQLTKSTTDPGSYSATLGSGTSGLPGGISIPGLGGGGTPYLDKGSYSITGPGGADIGAFQTSLTIPDSLTWTNQDSINNIPRSQSLSVTWTGGDPKGYVTITGSSSTNANVGAVFTCLAPAGAGQFSIPVPILLALPTSGVQGTGASAVPTGLLSVGTYGNPVRFTASGCDVCSANYHQLNAKNVNFQ